jgi:hypothetical protein
MTAGADVISLAGARERLSRAGACDAPTRSAGDRAAHEAGVRRRGWLRRTGRRVGDILALAALLVIPSVVIVALFLGAGWAMWERHGDLAALLGPYGAFWAWGGYALTTGAAYAWVMRRFPPAIVAAWVYVLFMVGVEGWAHVSFGPVALTAAAGVALLKAGGR